MAESTLAEKIASPFPGVVAQGIAQILGSGNGLNAGGYTAVKDATFTVDTSAYASGDLIADTLALSSAFRVSDGSGVLQSLCLIDKAAQGVALYVVLLSSTTSLGTVNAAPNISDANAVNILGVVSIGTSDYVTVSGTKVATIRNIGLPIKAISGTANLGAAILNSTGTPTFGTASDLVARFGILQD